MEAMDSDPDFIVFKLRSEMFELVGDLRKLEFEGVDEFTRFLERTRDAEAQTQIPKLQAMKDHMQLLKTRIIEKSRASSFAPLRGDTRHMPSSSPATAKPRLLSSAPSPMGSAPLQGDKPSSWPAKELEAPQRPQLFTYAIGAPITQKTYDSLARMATFLYDHLISSGDLTLRYIPTRWLESLPYTGDFGPQSIRNSLSNGYIMAGDVIAAARKRDKSLIVFARGRSEVRRDSQKSDAFREWAIDHLRKEAGRRLGRKDLQAAWDALSPLVKSTHNKFNYMFKGRGIGGGHGLTMEQLYAELENPDRHVQHAEEEAPRRRAGRQAGGRGAGGEGHWGESQASDAEEFLERNAGKRPASPASQASSARPRRRIRHQSSRSDGSSAKI